MMSSFIKGFNFMKKHFLFFSFLTLILSGCSTVNSQMNKQTSPPPKKNVAPLVQKTKTPEYTHDLVEADADDVRIKKETGESLDIDKDLKKVPKTSNHFLLKKSTKRMEYWIDFFANKNHERFQRFINNGEEYRPIIETILFSEGLPKELYFVGLIESGYYLTARSHAQAVGPWQFIRGTGKRYGLKITPELDERQDIFKATRAAALYFKDLHNVFSSWELALSAYNAGEYGVIRRIMKYGTRDFYELSKHKYLPSETINYVPKVLAAMEIINNPKKYGFVIPKKNKGLFELSHLTPTQKNLSLSVIAKRLNLTVDLLKKLNPELKGHRTPRHFAGTYYLRVPKNQNSIKLSDDSSLTSLPSSKTTSPSSRKEVNRRTAFIEKTLKSQRIVARHSSSPKVKITNNPVTYKIRKGDNLTEIAKLFDVKLSKIKTVNRLKRSKVMVGQKIVLPDTRKGIYTVKKGDHLTKVAKDLKRPIEALIKLNSLKRGEIYPGQKIIVNMD
jgi:membrane-bound lytic murein transglycosylase D